MSSLRRVPGRDPGADKTSNSYHEFGPFILDPVQHLLTKEGEPVSLTPKTYDTLLFLVQNSARMISKEELMSALCRIALWKSPTSPSKFPWCVRRSEKQRANLVMWSLCRHAATVLLSQ